MSGEIEHVHVRFGGHCEPRDIGRYVFVPDDGQRAAKLSERWTEARRVAEHYEFLIYSGYLSGAQVSACSTGIGGASVSIAVEELAALGADTFLRVGLTSSFDDEIRLGDLVIARGAVRYDGASESYVHPGYPAVADMEVVMAAISAAQELGYPYHVRTIVSTAAYAGWGPEISSKYQHSGITASKRDLANAGVASEDGESATLLTLGGLYGLRAGTINVCAQDRNGFDPSVEGRVIHAAIEAMCTLIRWDREKQATNAKYILPAVNIPALDSVIGTKS